MHPTRLFLSWLLLLLCLPLAAQKNIKIGDKALKQQDYYSAKIHYDAGLKAKEDQKLKGAKEASFFYNYATCCRIMYLHTKAEVYYAKVAQHPNKANFDDVDFYYAYSLKHNGKYVEAAAALEDFLARAEADQTDRKSRIQHLVPKARQEIKACKLAQEWVKYPDDSVQVRVMGKNINTQYSDFAPVELEGELFFSSLRFERAFQGRRDASAPKEKFLVGKVFVSKNKGTLSATPVSSVNVRYESTGNATFTADGQYMFFTHCVEDKEGVVRCRIQAAKRKGRVWDKPKYLPEPINLPNFTSTHPNIGYDSTAKQWTLFFVSNRTGGKGDMDLWRAPIIDVANLQFGTPENLGDIINTPEADATPFFHTPTQTLFFASKWHEGLGGFDLFKCERTSTGFSAPVNLGVPFNSAANDIYLWIHPSDTTGYFSSNRTGSQALTGESCCNDIYALSLPKRLTTAPPLWIAPPTPTRVDTPLVVKVDPPKVDTQAIVKIDPPKVDTPKIDPVKVDTQVVVKVDPPKVDTPKVEPPIVVEHNPTVDKNQKLTEINYLLPLNLYFHNDSPDSNTTKTTTKLTYEQTYIEYMKLEPDYVRVYGTGFKAPGEQEAARKRMAAFFEEEVTGEYERLNQCLDGILEALDMGFPLQIQVRGMASPRGASAYNKSLSKRRISSIRNYIEAYRGGAIKEYITSKQLVITELPMGALPESVATGELGDKQSIYGLEAVKDRRIEIVLVSESK